MNFEIDIDAKMRFPDAPVTAWNAILQNVIANAWNACLTAKTAKVKIEGSENGRGGVLRISDTGVGIDLDSADRMFDAFERKLQFSPAHTPIALGGNGMGLAIVRMLAETHRAKAAFVESEAGFATTFRLAWRS